MCLECRKTTIEHKKNVEYTRKWARETRRQPGRDGRERFPGTSPNCVFRVHLHRLSLYRGTCYKDAFNGPKRMATTQVACSRTPVVLITFRGVLHIFKTLKFLFLLFFNTFFFRITSISFDFKTAFRYFLRGFKKFFTWNSCAFKTFFTWNS